MVVGQLSDRTAYAAPGLFSDIEHLQQIRHAYISAPVKVPAGFLSKSTGKVCFARTGKTIDDDVPWDINETSCRQQKYLVLIQISAIEIDGVYI